MTLAATPELTMAPSATTVGINQAGGFVLVYDPDGAAGPSFPSYVQGKAKWKSSNSKLLQIQPDGSFTAAKEGKVTVTATYKKLETKTKVIIAGISGSRRSGAKGFFTRTYDFYVPKAYSAKKPLPLVVALHGGGGSGGTQAITSQLNQLADRNSFFVVYPDGTKGAAGISAWNAGRCCGAAAKNHIDDMGFIRAVVSEFSRDFKVDSKRVFATGMSNGAALSHRLGCEASDIFAAIAPVSGGLTFGDDGNFTECKPNKKMPVIEFHGTGDRNWPIDGGYGTDTMDKGYKTSIYQTIHEWAKRNQTDDPQKQILREGAVTCESSTDQSVVFCVTDPQKVIYDPETMIVWDGSGHAWPGGTNGGGDQSDWPTRDIRASELIWNFFVAHPKQ